MKMSRGQTDSGTTDSAARGQVEFQAQDGWDYRRHASGPRPGERGELRRLHSSVVGWLMRGRALGLVVLLILTVSVLAYLPVPARAAPHCPQKVGASITLSQDCVGSMTIVKSGITLNCAGHTVSGSGAGSGIWLGRGIHDVTVKNCVVTQFGHGFFLVGASSNTLASNIAKNNALFGFFLYGSSSNTLTGNTATGNGENGFLLSPTMSSGSSSNTLTGNTAYGNGKNGFYLFSNVFSGSSSNTLTGNTANRNANDGFFLDPGTSLNALASNAANNNGGYGYEDLSSGSGTSHTANTYTSNTCSENFLGGSNPSGLC